ncbi:hypothetical protein F4859DRAFT_525575 [Xylaria cf. heliscus]|nr:hypothetical protein F4859DRAFT_525575 [Xylaria cf. heliscus]
MRREGKAQRIQDIKLPRADDLQLFARVQRREVEVLIQEYRGRELPGIYNPVIVSELFSKQCRPWKGIIHQLRDTVMSSIEDFVTEALYYVADYDTAARISRAIIDPYLQDLGEALGSKLDELLEPHLLCHPITRNSLLTESV